MVFRKLKLKNKTIAAATLAFINIICILVLPLNYTAATAIILINFICILAGWLALSTNNKIVFQYKEMLLAYPTKKNYRICDIRNYDLVNLGGSDAKRLFNYERAGIKGLNWAQTSQTLKYDLLILKNFHSALKQNGIVILPISTDSFYPAKSDDRLYPFYARFIDPLLLSDNTQFSKTDSQVRREKYPLLFDFKNSIKILLNGHLETRKQEASDRPRGLVEKNHPDTFNLEHEINKNAETLKEIIDFCETRELKLVLLVLQYNKSGRKAREDVVFLQMLEIAKKRNIQIINHSSEDPADSRETTNALTATEIDPAVFTRNIFDAITKGSHV